MISRKRSFVMAGIAAAIFSTFMTNPSEAATVCSSGVPDVTSQVTSGATTFDCEFVLSVANSGSGEYDNLFFGGGFTEIGRVDPLPGSSGGLTITGTTKAGTWSISNTLLSTYNDFVLVFKSASQNFTKPGEVVAYNVGSVLSGDFLSPIFKSNGNCSSNTTTNPDCAREISHVALLGKEGMAVVPVPATLPLLFSGLILGGLVVGRKRRRS